MDIEVSCPVKRTFRVKQVEGLFDVPVERRSKRTWRAITLPAITEDWRIGAIVGPSGSGKTVIARTLYGKHFVEGAFEWPSDRSVLDGFDQSLEIKTVTSMLSSVGFASPPDWIKPYRVLSNGQRFRCDLARALLTKADAIAFDEFTSVVDRQVARFGAAAVNKTIIRGRTRGYAERFVAITCHYDVLDWLQPDWVFDFSAMAGKRLARRWVQRERKRWSERVKPRPPIRVDLHRCHWSLWTLFREHHYLSANLNKSAACYLGVWNRNPVAFVAVLPIIGHKHIVRISRVVVLPDYQAMGVGVRMQSSVAEIYRRHGKELRISAAHPAIAAHHKASPDWELVTETICRSTVTGIIGQGHNKSTGRALATFRYVGNSHVEDAR